MEDKAAQVYYCGGCGGVMAFDIPRQAFSCPNCGNTEELGTDETIEEHDFFSYFNDVTDDEWVGSVEIWRCESCGAEIVIGANSTTASCAYCGSSHVLKDRQGEGVRPEALIPFKVDRHEVGTRFRKWIRGKWFAPNSLKNLYQQDKLQSVYLPYWTYDANAEANYTGLGGRVYYVTVGSGKNERTEKRVSWYPVSGHVDNFFDDVLVSAVKEQDKQERKAGIYNTSECVPFDMAYLSGYQAEKYTLGAKEGYDNAKWHMENELREMARREILAKYDEARINSLSARFSEVKFKHILLPMWMSGYYYRNKLYRFFVNGQNGRITGTYPKSAIKVTFAIVIGVILAVLLFMWLLG